MSDSKKILGLVESAVREALEGRVPEICQQVLQSLEGKLDAVAAKAGPSGPAAPGEVTPTALLDAAVSSVQDGASQADVLRAMLEGAASFAGRAAIFVVRGGSIHGWRGAGFADDEAIKNIQLPATQGLAGRAIADRTPAAAAAAEFDSGFVAQVGNPVDGNALVLPLVIKEKAAALVYADPGTEPPGALDTSALQLLVRSAALWLEVLSLRKAGATGAPAEVAAEVEPPVAAAPPPPAPPRPAPVAEAAPAAAAGPAKAGTQPEDLPPEEQEVHKKAKRFAKLLVDEIKLYNQQKVQEGRKNRDLYDRLKEDIEKSRASYEKRYGQTSAANADYFQKEVIRILAENDASLLGSNFPS